MGVLDKIRAKITRAEQNLSDFQLGLSTFFDSSPYEVAMKEDAQRRQRIYYASKVEPVPDSLTAIAADVIQNLRSPLDQIAYQLVLDARGGTKPDWLVYYPIASKASEYKATRARNIKGVRQEVIDAIDATEPYPGGKGHALWQLNALNKPDKHHLLIGAATLPPGIDARDDFMRSAERLESKIPGAMELLRKMSPIIISLHGPFVALKVGDEIFAEPLDMEMAQERHFTFDVSLDAPGVITELESAPKTLQDMTNLVRDVIDRLGKFLP